LVTRSSHHGERRPAAGASTAGCQLSCSCYWSADQVTQLLPEDPTSWCRLTEGQFTLCNVADPVTAITTSWRRCPSTPPLGNRKPSVMLAEMLQFCPAGESAMAVFAFLNLQRFPREVRGLLSKDDSADMRPSPRKLTGSSPCMCRSSKGPKRPQQKAPGRRINLAERGTEKGQSLRTSVFLPSQVQRAGQVLRVGVLLAGKLGCRGVVAAVRPGHLFFVTDSLSYPRFLVDTGSAFSIVPWQIPWLAQSLWDRWPPHSLPW
jgi:hypothetical protein